MQAHRVSTRDTSTFGIHRENARAMAFSNVCRASERVRVHGARSRASCAFREFVESVYGGKVRHFLLHD